jgi:ATP-binding cassette subfamily F protein 3
MLQIRDLTFRMGERLLFDAADLTFPPRGRVGLVGRNGTGKSTLFRLIAGHLSPESGSVSYPASVRMGMVEQEAPGGPETLVDFVLAADKERSALLAEAETAQDPVRIADIQSRLVDIDAHAAPARAAAILSGLGFDAAAQARPCSDFSGGWRMRVALAAVLFMEPELLLLDEPTNYLDLEGALWLQSYLVRYPHTIVLISHDRELLNAVPDHIVHLESGKLALFRGNYASFERQYAEAEELRAKAAKKIEAERKHLQSFVDRFKAKASKATQAQSRVKRLAKLESVTVSHRAAGVRLSFPDPRRPLAPPLVKLEGASVGYDERVVLKRLSLSISDDDRIGLLGANGNGKSTLVKLVSGRLQPMAGQLRRSEQLEVAYFAQHQLDELPEGETPVSLVRALMPDATEAVTRSRAAQFGFGAEKAETPVAKLSGGERARLLLGLATFRGPHLLILDEPTNHLDIEARTALVEALTTYSGAVIIVSHDRFLLEATCDRLWLVADGSVRPFDGDMDDYAKLIMESRGSAGSREAARDTAADGRRQADERRNAARRRSELQPLKRQIDTLEADLSRLQALLAKVDAALAEPDVFINGGAKAAKLAGDRAALATRLAEVEERWLLASDEYERGMAS